MYTQQEKKEREKESTKEREKERKAPGNLMQKSEIIELASQNNPCRLRWQKTNRKKCFPPAISRHTFDPQGRCFEIRFHRSKVGWSTCLESHQTNFDVHIFSFRCNCQTHYDYFFFYTGVLFWFYFMWASRVLKIFPRLSLIFFLVWCSRKSGASEAIQTYEIRNHCATTL